MLMYIFEFAKITSCTTFLILVKYFTDSNGLLTSFSFGNDFKVILLAAILCAFSNLEDSWLGNTKKRHLYTKNKFLFYC